LNPLCCHSVGIWFSDPVNRSERLTIGPVTNLSFVNCLGFVAKRRQAAVYG
jgi:hypothetical protein